jgi:hypothetical protein
MFEMSKAAHELVLRLAIAKQFLKQMIIWELHKFKFYSQPNYINGPIIDCLKHGSSAAHNI